jgi:hypothetical protein
MMICDDCGATLDEMRAFGTPAGWVYPCGSCACRMFVPPAATAERGKIDAESVGPTVKKTTARTTKGDR